MRMVKAVLQILLLGVLISARAEYRTWSAADGSGSVKAELQQRTMKSVRLKSEDGRVLNIPFGRLSREDQVYAELQTPPDLSIEVDPNENHVGNSVIRRGEEDGYLILDFEIEVRKKSRLSYSRPLKLELYVVGKQEVSGRLVLLRVHTAGVRFSGQVSKRSIRPGPIVLQRTAEAVSSESDYAGYLVVITDERGERLTVKSNRNQFADNADFFAGLRTGAEFYSDELEGSGD